MWVRSLAVSSWLLAQPDPKVFDKSVESAALGCWPERRRQGRDTPLFLPKAFVYRIVNKQSPIAPVLVQYFKLSPDFVRFYL